MVSAVLGEGGAASLRRRVGGALPARWRQQRATLAVVETGGAV